MIVLDNTILNVAIPTIVRDLDATNSQLQWMVDAYTLVFAGLLLTAGSLGDRFGRARRAADRPRGLRPRLARVGVRQQRRPADRHPRVHGHRRRVHHAGDAVDHHQRLPARRAGQGHRRVGRRPPASPACSGRSTGGFLLEHFYWGSVFLVNVPIVIFGLIAGFFLIPTSKDPSAPRLDPIGAVLSIVGLVVAALRDHRGAAARLDATPTILGASSLGVVAARRLRLRGSATPTTRCSTSGSSRTRASPPPASGSR